MINYTTLGGRAACTQCNALSKRTRQRCRAPAVRGKTKFRFHGGAKGSGRPVVHGRETREKRAERSLLMSELPCLEEIGFTCGLYPADTPRLAGRKPLGYTATGDAWGELRKLCVEDRKKAILEIPREKIS